MKISNAIPRPPPTATRVQRQTRQEINDRIRHGTAVELAELAGDPPGLERRLRSLDTEWDIERVLQTNFGLVGLVSVTLGALVSQRWFLLAGIAAVFMGQHAIQGWCPPVPVFRRAGFRTAREINQERFALKAIRGDFRGSRDNPPHALEATRAG